MTYDVGRIRKFSNELKTIEERVQHVTNLLEVENYDMIDTYSRTSMLEGNKRFEERPINITIEALGTYLIRANDTESSRSGEYSFFETEKDYRKVKIGKDTISTDTSLSDEIGGMGIASDTYFAKEERKDLTLDVSELDSTQIKRLIRMGLSEKDNKTSKLQRTMAVIYNDIDKVVVGDLDKDILNLMVSGLSDEEISVELSIPRRTVNYRVNKIVGLVGGVYNECRSH